MSNKNEITKYMRSDLVRSRFAEVLGDRQAGPYIASIMIAVAESDALQKCEVPSIYTSALRAATLRLSVDPGIGQAYLVPFKGRATLVVGYKGLQDMAIRTGRYRYINVGKIYEGESVEINRISGFHSISGNKKSDKHIGWIGAFEMMNGFGKTIYLTNEEIHQHAKKYSKNYDSKESVWNTDRDAMERKTILRLLIRKWGFIDPADERMLEQVEAEGDSVIEGAYLPDDLDTAEKETIEEAKRTEKENLEQLRFGE